MSMLTNSEWQDRLIRKNAGGDHGQYHKPDLTLSPLKELKEKGYTHVTWKTKKSCYKCKNAARRFKNVSIDKLINQTEHDAPMATQSHPDDDSRHCYLLITAPENAKEREVLESETIPALEEQILALTEQIESAEEGTDTEDLESQKKELETKLEEAQQKLEAVLPPMTLDYDGNLDEAQ